MKRDTLLYGLPMRKLFAGNDHKEKMSKDESELFRSRWKKELELGDPYYNPNLTLLRGDFGEK